MSDNLKEASEQDPPANRAARDEARTRVLSRFPEPKPLPRQDLAQVNYRSRALLQATVTASAKAMQLQLATRQSLQKRCQS